MKDTQVEIQQFFKTCLTIGTELLVTF